MSGDYFTYQIEKEDERRRVRKAYYALLLERFRDTRNDEIVRLKAQVRYWKNKAIKYQVIVSEAMR